jgi:hypothetical protein
VRVHVLRWHSTSALSPLRARQGFFEEQYMYLLRWCLNGPRATCESLCTESRPQLFKLLAAYQFCL